MTNLLSRDAEALQSGDEDQISDAREALAEKKKAIVINIERDTRIRDAAEDIDSQLTERISAFQDKIDVFENGVYLNQELVEKGFASV